METKQKILCYKCSGTGMLPHYIHQDDGVCYECNGSGKVNDRTVLAEALPPLNQQRVSLSKGPKRVIFMEYTLLADETERTEAMLFEGGELVRELRGSWGDILKWAASKGYQQD